MITIYNKNDQFIFENDYIKAEFEKVNGRLFTKSVLNKKSGYAWSNSEDSLPTVYLPGYNYSTCKITFTKGKNFAENGEEYGYGEFVFENEDAKITYVLSIYENLPVLNAKFGY